MQSQHDADLDHDIANARNADDRLVDVATSHTIRTW